MARLDRWAIRISSSVDRDQDRRSMDGDRKMAIGAMWIDRDWWMGDREMWIDRDREMAIEVMRIDRDRAMIGG